MAVDVFEGVEGDIARQVDGLGNRGVDIVLHHRLHGDVGSRLQALGVDEGRGERRCCALQLAEEAVGMVAGLDLFAAAVGLQNVALMGKAKDRLDTGGDVVGQQRDGPCRRHRGDKGIAYAVFGDGIAQLRRQGADGLASEKGLFLEQRKAAFPRGPARPRPDRRHRGRPPSSDG